MNNQEPEVSSEAEQTAAPEAAPEPEAPTEAPVETGGAGCCSKKTKWIIAAVIAVLVAAGIAYYYTAGVGTEEPLGQQEAESIVAEIEEEADAVAEQLQQQGDSDAVADIEADLGATELEALDKELESIESEFSF